MSGGYTVAADARRCRLRMLRPRAGRRRAAAAPGAARAAASRCTRASRTALQRTVAWLLAAVVLYLPANLLPVMATASVLGRESHTIVGGIIELWTTGSRELAPSCSSPALPCRCSRSRR